MKVNIVLTDEEKVIFKSLNKLDCSLIDCKICPFYVPTIDLTITPNGATTKCLITAINERSVKLI